MTDHELEQRIRAWYRNEVGDGEAAPPNLHSGLAQITVMAPAAWAGLNRRFVILAAAAMLTVTIGSAVAIGSGVIRPPWIPNDPLIPIGFHECEPTLANEVVLEFSHERILQPSTEYGSIPVHVVYQDGVVLRLSPEGLAQAAGWEERRISTEGLERMVAAIRASTPLNCETTFLPERQDESYTLVMRDDAGIGVTNLRAGHFQTGVGTAEAHSAALELANRFADPDLFLPSGDWINAGWVPYVAERYLVQVALLGDKTAHWDTVLPDGSTLWTFGQFHNPEFSTRRCGVVSADEARGIAEALGLLPRGSDDLFLWDAPLGDGYLSLTPVLPHEAEGPLCGEWEEAPAAEQSVQPDPEVAGVAVCELVPNNVLLLDGVHPVEAHFVNSGAWARCSYQRASPSGTDYYFGMISLRTHATSAAEALELARLTFGERGFTESRIAGRTVYLNECVWSTIPCVKAIAITADPFFVILESALYTFPEGSHDYEADLRKLAAEVIAALPETP